MSKTSPQTIASAVALTTALVARGSAINVLTLTSILLQLSYATGTGGTGMEYDIEISGAETEPSTDAQWWPAQMLVDESGVPASEVLTATSARIVHQITTAQPRRAHWIDLRGVRWLRVRAKETGGAIGVAGTVTATGYGEQ